MPFGLEQSLELCLGNLEVRTGHLDLSHLKAIAFPNWVGHFHSSLMNIHFRSSYLDLNEPVVLVVLHQPEPILGQFLAGKRPGLIKEPDPTLLLDGHDLSQRLCRKALVSLELYIGEVTLLPFTDLEDKVGLVPAQLL